MYNLSYKFAIILNDNSNTIKVPFKTNNETNKLYI